MDNPVTVKATVTKGSPGELTAVEELYVRHAPAGLRLAYFLTGDSALAEDLLHEAFVRLIGRFQHVRAPEAFSAYLRRHRVERAYLERLRGRAGPELDSRDPETSDELWRALRILPGRQRAAVILRYYKDLSERETAEILRCSASAVNSLVSRAIAALRERIRGDDL